MSISSHQIHNVLRVYGKQFRRGLKLNRIKKMETSENVDQIKISPEAKRRQVVDRVAAEIMFRLADPQEGGGDVEREVLSTLKQEFGRELEFTYNIEAGKFNFGATGADKEGNESELLSEEENETLNQRLTEITRDIVNRTMI
jgi:hypothetical protein